MRLGKSHFLRTLAVLCLAGAPVQAQVPGAVVPLAVEQGRCQCVLATPQPGDKYLLIVGSLSRRAGPYLVQVASGPATGPAVLPVEQPSGDPSWSAEVASRHARLARRRRCWQGTLVPSADPPRERLFHLFIKGHDFHDPDNYVTVPARLQAVGRHCQVYVERDVPEASRLGPAVAEAVRVFDQEVYPRARRWLGEALDVDRDGRFTILFTGWLAKMADGPSGLGGFVRASDFYRDLQPPFGNRCDMMYLNTDLEPGSRLRTILAHEYTHAVVSSEHLFGPYLPEVSRQDEENWLNEALAHLAEDWHGYGWCNLDYRISAFLSAPERYQLVVPDYHRAGLWRSHGHRGATYLFLRWCTDRHGPDLVRRLVQSNLAGVDNLEVASQERFRDLFRQWSAALHCSLALRNTRRVDGFPLSPLARFDLYLPLEGRLLCGPRFHPVGMSGGCGEVTVAGTSAACFLLHSSAADHAQVSITADPEAELQVTLVRLPASGRLAVQAQRQGDRFRLVAAAHDQDLTLQSAAWERLVPATNRPGDTSFRPEIAGRQMVADWFGEPHLPAGQSRSSVWLPLPDWKQAGVPLVCKVLALDALGNRVAGWASVD
jgi:hypothetical protein